MLILTGTFLAWGNSKISAMSLQQVPIHKSQYNLLLRDDKFHIEIK